MKEQEDISKNYNIYTSDKNLRILFPFSYPANYFDNIEQQILRKIEDQSINSDDGINLPDLQKAPTFAVPDGYFENLEQRLLRRSQPIHRKIFSLKKLQVAAVVFGGLLLASVVYYMGKPSTKTSSPVSFSEPPTMRDITNAELTDFAEETRTGYNYAGKKNRIDTDQLFKSVSSTELQNFLYENAANESELF